MRIDAHQHFWTFDPIRDAWINDEMQVIRRDFHPKDLKPILEAARMDGCVAVQADQSLKETDFLLSCAKGNPFVKKVVGWIDLCSEKLERQLEQYQHESALAGFRHIVQAEPPAFLERGDFRRGIGHIGKAGYTYDILIYPQHLQSTQSFIHAFPNQQFVIDHLAKPQIRSQEWDNWAPYMKEISRFDNVWIKLSGMVTEADMKHWKVEEMLPYLDFLLECFGTERLMYGSDWPVCLLAADYDEQLRIVEHFISTLSASEQAAIMGENACDFYGIKHG